MGGRRSDAPIRRSKPGAFLRGLAESGRHAGVRDSVEAMMNRCFAFLFVSFGLVLAACGDSSSDSADSAPTPCGGSEPEGQCNAITECVWTSDTASACLQICESTAVDCAEDQECRRRLKRSSSGDFKVTRVCFPKVEPAETKEAQASRETFCAERSNESCSRSALCGAQLATKLFIDDQCQALVATDCFPHYGIDGDPEVGSCTLSSWFATREDSPGDVFFFGADCGQPGFEGFYPQSDDPLFEIVYEEFPGWASCF